jgi:hypothetical protein
VIKDPAASVMERFHSVQIPAPANALAMRKSVQVGGVVVKLIQAECLTVKHHVEEGIVTVPSIVIW